MSDINKRRDMNTEIRSSKENSMLSRLLQGILLDLGFTPNRLDTLISKYIFNNNKLAKTHSRFSKNINLSQLKIKILGDEITWKTMIMVLFSVMSVKKLKVTFELTHANGSVTKHTHTTVNNKPAIKKEQ